MKNIQNKFKINIGTYFLLLIACFTGFYKNILLIFLIVIVHELGHILSIRKLEYNIESVEIFPFGGVTKVNKPINTPLKSEIKIAFSGVFFQIILFFIFFILNQQGIIREQTFFMFNSYNIAIALFNLLPIIPLDGSIIVHSIFEYFFSFKKSYYYYQVFSVLSFLLFAILALNQSLNNYMILTFLLYKMIDVFKKRKLIQNKFFLERYLYEFPYRNIKSHSYPKLDDLKKDTLHFFWIGDKYLHEKEFLKKRYKKQ